MVVPVGEDRGNRQGGVDERDEGFNETFWFVEAEQRQLIRARRSGHVSDTRHIRAEIGGAERGWRHRILSLDPKHPARKQHTTPIRPFRPAGATRRGVAAGQHMPRVGPPGAARDDLRATRHRREPARAGVMTDAADDERPR